ncbi:CHAT domain-containing protein [Rhodococcus sp. NPDC003318]|uniref:CHAT domain-containing protein n=1 Tax=Rhodococcus sp. NPDC003318 TaxID=3364503 RepID=UPI0036A7F035
MAGFEELEISVLAAGDDIWVSAQSRLGSVFAVRRPQPAWTFPADLVGRSVTTPAVWLRDAVRHARSDAGSQARAVGAALTDLVFGVSEVGTLLQRTRGAAGLSGAQVLVRILAAPHGVCAWPWELMLDPEQPDRCLAMARDVHVVRSGRSRTYPVRQEPVAPPLNLLLVMSSPPRVGPADTETPFDLYAEKRSLLGELEPLERSGLLRIVVEDRPTVEQLRTLMGKQRNGFHLLHYLGHANPDGLRLERRNGRGTVVPSRDFALLLQQLPDLRLAVFAGCETARAPDEEPGNGGWPGPLSTADLCVRDASPMVIGMQAVLPFGTERLLTRFFYQALTAGHSVAESLRLARLAINGDEDCGRPLLNWAVPCLFVGGSQPGAVVDPDAGATPMPARPRVGLRLGVRQGELRFISRLAELREAVDVLSGHTSARMLHVVGMPATGKTALLDRVIEELDVSITYLFISARLLLADPDPVRKLAELVVEVMQSRGVPTVPPGTFGAGDWWERVVGGLANMRLAIVIDDCDLLAGDASGGPDVLRALGTLTARRGHARLAVIATRELTELTGAMRDSEVRTIRLDPLSWPEVWQWIRRNLPALTRFPEKDLSLHYTDIRHLEQWEQLADIVSRDGAYESADLPRLVRSLGARPERTQSAEPVGADFFGAEAAGPATEAVPVRCPLRLAVAGPFTAGRRNQIAVAVTQCAIAQGVPGRVVVSGETGVGESALAELLPHELAFPDGMPSGIDRWLREVGQAGADIVVVDYGKAEPTDTENAIVDELVAQGRLVIASGDHSDTPTFPAWGEGVLAVGAIEDDGSLTHETPYFPELGKPDIYAPRTISGTTYEVIAPGPEMEGTTFAALYVAVAAMLVWATDRDLAAQEIRDILMDGASPIDADGGEKACRLRVEAALEAARRGAIATALGSESMPLGPLLAETSVRPELAVPILDQLVATGAVHRVVRGGVEQFEAASAPIE